MYDYSRGSEEERVAAQWEFVMATNLLDLHDDSINPVRPVGVPAQG